MASRQQARKDAAFARGALGVDGAATEEKQDAAELELGKAREQYLRGRTYLGRELLTWLLWRSESSDALLEENEGGPVHVVFIGRVVLRGIHGEVTELSARGAQAGYDELVKRALARGLLVHSARLQLTHGEQRYELTVDAEHLDVRAAKLPELMAEDEAERVLERIALAERASSFLEALTQRFLSLRTSPGWSKKVVPAMRSWMQGDDTGQPARAVRATA